VSTDIGLTPEWRRELHARLPAGMELKVFAGIGRHTLAFSPSMIRWVARHVRDFDLVVVRALFHPLSSEAARVAHRHRVPYLVTPHGMLSRYTFQHHNRLPKRLYWRLVESGTLEHAAGVRFTADAERRDAARLGLRIPTFVIPHPIEPGVLPLRRPDAQREHLLFLGRLDPVKGLDVLLPAFARLASMRPGATLVIAGAGKPRFERLLRSEVAHLVSAGAVRFAGFADESEKRILLEQAAALVLPSRQESFGMAVVEAMAAGVPVVVSPAVGIGEDIARAGAGLVVERDPRALAEVLDELLSDPEARMRMGEAGRRLVRERYSPSVVGPKIAAMYREMSGCRTLTAAR